MVLKCTAWPNYNFRLLVSILSSVCGVDRCALVLLHISSHKEPKLLTRCRRTPQPFWLSLSLPRISREFSVSHRHRSKPRMWGSWRRAKALRPLLRAVVEAPAAGACLFKQRSSYSCT